MHVVLTLSEGSIHELSTDIQADTSGWTRGNWMDFGFAMMCAFHGDRDNLVELVGPIDVCSRHIDGDSEIQFIEVDGHAVVDSFDAQRAVWSALKEARAWCAQQSDSEDILAVIDSALTVAE